MFGTLVQVRVDLAVPVGVVAERDRVDAQGEHLVRRARRDAEAAGRVLAVDDDEIQRELLAQGGKQHRSVRRPIPPTMSPTKRSSLIRCAYCRNEEDGCVSRARSTRRRSRPPNGPPRPRTGRRSALDPARGPAAGAARRVGAGAGVRAGSPGVRRGRRGRARAQPGGGGAREAAAQDHLPRGLAVLLVYLALVLILLGVGLLLVNAIANQVESFQRNLPHLVDQANKSLADLQKTLNDNGIKVEITSQGRTALQTLQDNLSQSTGDIVSSARDILGKVVEGAFGLVLTIVISIYMLLYGPRDRRLRAQGAAAGRRHARRRLPAAGPEGGVQLRARAGRLLADHGLQRRHRPVVPGRRRHLPRRPALRLFFGAFYGLMELVPYIGPILGGAPPVIVALFQDPLSGLWVILALGRAAAARGPRGCPAGVRAHAAHQPPAGAAALLIGRRSTGSSGRSSRCRSPRSRARPCSTCAATSCSSRGARRAPPRSSGPGPGSNRRPSSPSPTRSASATK